MTILEMDNVSITGSGNFFWDTSTSSLLRLSAIVNKFVKSSASGSFDFFSIFPHRSTAAPYIKKEIRIVSENRYYNILYLDDIF